MADKQGPPSYEETQGISNPCFMAGQFQQAPEPDMATPYGAYSPDSPPNQPAPPYTPGNVQYPVNQASMFGQSNVVFQQPQPGVAYAMSVPDNMGMAIFATLCCCWPIGIFAIMKASESRAALERQDFQTAMTAATESKRLSHISMVAGGVMVVIAIIVLVVVLVTVNNSHYDDGY